MASVAATGSVDMAVLMQQSAAKIGLKLDVKRVPADGYWSNQWLSNPVGFGNVNPRPSADILLTQFFKSDAQWNESGWKNPQFDQLVVAARGEGEGEEQRSHRENLRREGRGPPPGAKAKNSPGLDFL